MSRRTLRDLIAQRIELLEELAIQNARQDFTLASDYARMAQKLRLRHRVKAGRLMICKGCNAPMIPGISARVRKRRLLVITCLRCGRMVRKRLER